MSHTVLEQGKEMLGVRKMLTLPKRRKERERFQSIDKIKNRW
jgi:hypothetical protein